MLSWLGMVVICLVISMTILLVVFGAPMWFKIIFFILLVGWMYHGIQGILYAMLAIVVTAIGIAASLFWSSKEEKRHHSEEGTKFWE